jgi:hypothetical protein
MQRSHEVAIQAALDFSILVGHSPYLSGEQGFQVQGHKSACKIDYHRLSIRGDLSKEV